MPRDRSEKIEALFHAALEIDPEKRSAFLEEACRGVPSLKKELESLLDAREDQPDFFEKPAWSIVFQREAKEIAPSADLAIEPGLPHERLGDRGEPLGLSLIDHQIHQYLPVF